MTAGSYGGALLALGAVVALILLGARLLRGFRPAGMAAAAGRLSIAGSLALDAKRRVVMVRCDGRCVLVLTGPTDTVLGWLPDEPA